MLKGTDFWTHGEMDLFVNNKPAHVYIPKENVKEAFEKVQSRLSKEGSIPIGIDHLPDNIIKANPILAKLDLLNVGEITEIEYANDTITIVEAELTNPQIRQLYENGELDMVSIVATSNVAECPNDYDYIINHTDITRVDIVEKGACPTCNIPKPHDDEPVVYARYSIKEEEIMAEDALTPEAVQEIINTALNPIKEQLDKQNKRLDDLEASVGESNNNEEGNETNKEDEEVKARLAEANKEVAKAKVQMAITSGKLYPAEEESMIELCASNSEAFDKLIESRPVIVPLEQRMSVMAGNSGSEPKDEPDEDDKLLAEVQAAFSKGE